LSLEEQLSEGEIVEVREPRKRRCSGRKTRQRRKVQYKTNVILYMCKQCGAHELWEEVLRHFKAKAAWLAIAGQRVATHEEELFLQNLGVMGAVFYDAIGSVEGTRRSDECVHEVSECKLYCGVEFEDWE
jgi:hypothetical protein